MRARGAAAPTAPPPIPPGHEDAAFGHMLAERGLHLRGSLVADRDYALLICDQLDDDVAVVDVLADVATGTGLDWEGTLFLIAAAVACYRPAHFDAVLPPEPGMDG